MKHRAFYGFLVLALVLSLSSAAFAQGSEGPVDRFQSRELPEGVAAQKLDQPLELSGIAPETLAGGLFSADTSNRVIIRLTQDSVVEARGKGIPPGQAKKQVESQQQNFLSRVQQVDPSARVLAEVQVVLNAVFVEVDGAALATLATLANDPAVLRIAPVKDYEIDLSETVPYIGASAVQGMGYSGTGVRVAVLDSGIDYLHAALGGSGDPAEYAANDPSIIEPGTFPTAKVVGGYDFVGGAWYGSGGPAEAPDPDPLDAGTGGGHGTHVSHIIAGVESAAGAGGVAPGASLYAVKVCSSISTACSGIALIQGMEFAVDPNGDGDPSDHVDLINMSLGSPYGNPFDDDLSFAVDNATAAGVLTVASTGNSADKPYASGSPGNAATALATAQTNVPSASLPLLLVVSPEGYGPLPAEWQPWSAPLTSRISGPLQYGDGTGGQLLGCSLGADPNSVADGTEPYPPGSLDGKIVLVDRGVCGFSVKIYNIQRGGGVAGIIGLVAPGDPFAGGFGGGGPFTIPGYMISQANSNLLKSLLPGGVVVAFDPAFGIPLVMHMVGSSSRGPSVWMNMVKPEIGAPGASVSAIYGTGTGVGPFGGTSGAAPMVTGSAALLKQAYPGRSPLELKAALMNNGETDIMNVPAFFGGSLAPITRIGGGEVRVDRALNASAAAWDQDAPSGALSFGFVDVDYDVLNLHKKVVVHNYSDHDITYNIIPSFRFADDEATGAVLLEAPPKVKVKAGREATFPVKLTINGGLLWTNYMNSGSMGANPAGLTLNEFDGYLTLDDGANPIHLAWHVLPRQAARTNGRPILTLQGGQDSIELANSGVGTAQNDAYSLLALSEDIPEGPRGGQAPTPDIRAVGINTFPVPAGYCSANPSFLWAFAVNTWERQSHLLPVSHQFYLDTNRDGVDDYVVLNRDASGLGTITDGRQLAWALNLATGTASAFFYAEHATNTGNTVLYICGEQVGLTGTDMLARNVGLSVYAQDFYFGGPGDLVEGLVVTPLGEQYYGIPADIPGKSTGTLQVIDYGPFPGNTPELGVMLLTNGDRGAGFRGGATQDSEVLLFTVK